MVDTIDFILHNCNTYRKRDPLETEEQHQQNPWLNKSNHDLFMALKEYKNQFVERRIELHSDYLTADENPKNALEKKQFKAYHVFSPKILLVDKDSELLYTKNTRGKVTLDSSNYNVVFDMLSSQDKIKFSLSIPKYLYGHSIAQFVPNINSPKFYQSADRLTSPFFQATIIQHRITSFIMGFLKDLSYLFSIPYQGDPQDIEIRRLDFCYNQFFRSKNEALEFLSAQKKIISKNKRKSAFSKSEDTSLYYRNSKRTYLFKIYHKGSEFSKQGDSDLKRLLKLNEDYFVRNYDKLFEEIGSLKDLLSSDYEHRSIESYFNIYKVSVHKGINVKFCKAFESFMPYKCFFLLDEANKILRYEMNFTTTYISTIYKKEIYCKDSIDYKKLKVNYKRVQQYYNHLNKGNISKSNQIKRRYNITNQCISEYDAFKSHIESKNNFYLRVPEDVLKSEKAFNKVNRLFKVKGRLRINSFKEALLSDKLLEKMIDLFFAEIDQFQIKRIENPMSVLDKLDKYNKNVIERQKQFTKLELKNLTRSKKIKMDLIVFNRSRLEIYLKEIDKGESMDTIKEKFKISRSTFYELKTILKKFNLNEKMIKSKFDFSHIKTNFHKYYQNFSIDKNYGHSFFSDPKLMLKSDTFIYRLSK
ncbi:phage/plasmid replication protein [Mesoflavibacter sp. SCSIO 43206]|uniref:phage/plasmid replication domain-containing protein n=1 Tax=Mesoflavibacter sp. SCSIO 43206 TaxID=2779362 RepID=UPI001CA8239A|nr:phage/plasmid replication protein [Mesoflavibacter sp. SCSIO 43206]UAB75151.1 hypothetical protein INR78_12275 [Mesoflavibacter sp. SCSIO 43206]